MGIPEEWRHRVEGGVGGRVLKVRMRQVYLRPSWVSMGTSASTTPIWYDPGTNAAYIAAMPTGFEMMLPVWEMVEIKRGAVLTRPEPGDVKRQFVVISVERTEVILLPSDPGLGGAARHHRAVEHREVADALIMKRWSYHGIDKRLADEEEAAYRLFMEPD